MCAHQLIFEYIETFLDKARINEHCGIRSPDDYEETFRLNLQTGLCEFNLSIFLIEDQSATGSS